MYSRDPFWVHELRYTDRIEWTKSLEKRDQARR